MSHFKTIIISLIVAVGVFFGAPHVPGSESLGGAIETIKVDFGDGFTVSAGQSAVKQFTQGGSVLRINQTGATRTLTAAEFAANTQFVVDSTATGAALSLSLPATSTMTAIIPNAGDRREWIIENNHTAAATTTTVIAGTGIDLQGDTANDDVLNAGVFGLLTCWRQYTTDVACNVVETVVAD